MDVKQPNRVHDATTHPRVMPNNTSNKNILKLTQSNRVRLLIAVIIIGFLLAIALLNLFNGPSPDGNRYQAVFLTNGRVFFGKLKSTHGQYVTLDNAYYSKDQTTPANATADQRAATSTALIQVGKEVYGPENSMQIRADQILFWQDLKSDSKVAQAIDGAK